PQGGLRKFLPSMSKCHVPQACQTIDEFPSIRSPHSGALTRDPDEGLLMVVGMKLWMNQVVLVGLDDFSQINGHDSLLPDCLDCLTTLKAVHNNRGGDMHAYLVQHGKAKSAEGDPNRGLSDDGREEVTRIAEFLEDLRITISLIHHSGKLRAEET